MMLLCGLGVLFTSNEPLSLLLIALGYQLLPVYLLVLFAFYPVMIATSLNKRQSEVVEKVLPSASLHVNSKSINTNAHNDLQSQENRP